MPACWNGVCNACGGSSMKRVAYEQNNEENKNQNVGDGKEGREMGMALYCSAVCGIFTLYGISDLLCSVCEHEQMDRNQFPDWEFLRLRQLHCALSG